MDRLILRKEIISVIIHCSHIPAYSAPRDMADQILALIPDCEACVEMSAGKPVKATNK